jgi:alkaline phosphatase
MPFFTLNYANGMGFFDHFQPTGGRVDPNGMHYERLDFRQPATVPLEDETHSGEDVAVFAEGPWAHLFTGVYEQNYIAHGLLYATCLGPVEYLVSDQCATYRDAAIPCSSSLWLIVVCSTIMVIF